MRVLLGVLVLLIAVVHSAQVPIRNYTIPSTYSVVVSTNSDEIGFTYAYREYYNSSLNLWRIDVNGTQNIYDLTTQIFRMINSTACTYFNLSGVESDYPMEPSTLRLQRALENVTYVGNTTVARDILSDYYTWSIENVTINGTVWNVTDDFYFSASTGLPVRYVSSFYNNSTTPTFTIYSDWVNWITDLDSSLFSLPSDCSLNPDNSDNPFPSLNVTDHPPLSDDTPFPILSSSFYAVVEGKFQAVDNGVFETLGLEWYYSSQSNIERIDLVLDDNDFTRSEIYNYGREIMYSAYSGTACDYDLIPDEASVSILANKGVGTIHQLFIPSASSPLIGFDTSLAKYTGQTLVRGVRADTWTVSGVQLTIGDTSYLFNTSIYFFPKGWQFFGRDLSTSVVPMRVRNNGTVTVNGATQNYFGEWDIFQYVDNQSDPSKLNGTSLGCEEVPPFNNEIVYIPYTYSVFISINDVVQGITFAYEEFSDVVQNLTRIFIYGGEQYILDLTEQTEHNFNPYNVSAQCRTYPLSNSSAYFRPTHYLFNSINTTNFVKKSQSTESRGILADYYEYNSNAAIGLFVDAIQRYPLRLVFGDYVIDYVDWNAADLNETVFTKPTNCINETQPSRTLTPSTYNSSKADNVTMPSLSSQLFVVLEGKSILFSSGDSLTQFEWYYDSVARKERINYLNYGVSSMTYDYASGNVTNYQGFEHMCISDDIASYGSGAGLLGTGFLHDIIDPNFQFKTISGALPTPEYAGRSILRSKILASKWTFNNISANNNDLNLTYDATVYFYPEGWSFPGRNITNERVLMRIEILNGIATFNDEEGTQAIPFNETWDLFEYHPAAPLASSFDPCVDSLIPLPLATPSTTTTSSTSSTPSTSTGSTATTSSSTTTGAPVKTKDHGLSGGVTAAIVIIIVVAVLGLLIGVWLTIRKRRGTTTMGTRENRTFEHMNEDEI